jgi:hypothetical protein
MRRKSPELDEKRALSEISLVNFLKRETRQQRVLVEELEVVQDRLDVGRDVLRDLYGDAFFLTTLRAEGVDDVPRFLSQPSLVHIADAQHVIAHAGARYVRSTFRNKCSIYRQRIANFHFAEQNEILTAAISQGVSRDELSKRNDLPLKSVNRLADLLIGISPMAAEILRGASGSIGAYDVLRRMSAGRQLDVAGLMVRRNDYSSHFCEALLAATKKADLVIPFRKNISAETCLCLQRLESELRNLQGRLEDIQNWHSINSIRLVVVQAHFRWLLSNVTIQKWLATYRPIPFGSMVAFAQTTRGQLELARH